MSKESIRDFIFWIEHAGNNEATFIELLFDGPTKISESYESVSPLYSGSAFKYNLTSETKVDIEFQADAPPEFYSGGGWTYATRGMDESFKHCFLCKESGFKTIFFGRVEFTHGALNFWRNLRIREQKVVARSKDKTWVGFLVFRPFRPFIADLLAISRFPGVRLNEGDSFEIDNNQNVTLKRIRSSHRNERLEIIRK